MDRIFTRREYENALKVCACEVNDVRSLWKVKGFLPGVSSDMTDLDTMISLIFEENACNPATIPTKVLQSANVPILRAICLLYGVSGIGPKKVLIRTIEEYRRRLRREFEVRVCDNTI